MQSLWITISEALACSSKKSVECWAKISEKCNAMKLVKETDYSVLDMEMDSKLTFVNNYDPTDSVFWSL